MKLLDLSGPLQVFSDANDCIEDTRSAYGISVASMHGGMIQTDTPVLIDTVAVDRLQRKPIDTLVVVGGRGVQRAAQEREFINLITRLGKRSRRVVSVCSGAFLLAEAGLLHGRRAVTHWDSCDELATRYPSVSVQKNRIYVRDGDVWTSAGVTAGIDLALALVEADWGRSMALSIARRLVTYMVRPGGQSQFSDVLELQDVASGGRFDALIRWICENLQGDLSVNRLAEQASMSSRSFSRRFHEELGQSPAKFVEGLRVSSARQLLEETDESIYRIAHRCGFGDEERMRRAFLRNLSVSPSDYRARFM